ncbi:MAG TPA: pseudouridine synthase [Nitrospirota bacterium]|nr:pseudouridine synthase [Nitrospirota bacterium]
MEERLQKIISASGVASRRSAEQLIVEGRVRVNGTVVTELGAKADANNDHIKVDGKLINPKQPRTYIMLNKPAGYVTTMYDPEGRPTVQDLLKGIKTRVYPVGRLDYNTEGLLLMTNDGDFAHLITHPKHEFPKTYLAKVKGVLDERSIEMLEKGMFLQDGKTAPAKVKKIRKEEVNSWVEITIHEGRKRQVRRMFDHVGRSVIKLKRIRTGGLSLGDLPEGRFRHLTLDEVKTLRETALKTDDSGHHVRVYRPAVKTLGAVEDVRRRTMDEGRQRTESRTHKTENKVSPREGKSHQLKFSGQRPSEGWVRRPRTRIMQDTRGGKRRNKDPWANQGVRRGISGTGVSERKDSLISRGVSSPRLDVRRQHSGESRSTWPGRETKSKEQGGYAGSFSHQRLRGHSPASKAASRRPETGTATWRPKDRLKPEQRFGSKGPASKREGPSQGTRPDSRSRGRGVSKRGSRR